MFCFIVILLLFSLTRPPLDSYVKSNIVKDKTDSRPMNNYRGVQLRQLQEKRKIKTI